MAKPLNRQAIEAFITTVRAGQSGQSELADDREPGLRIRVGDRTATWFLMVRLGNGKRTRIKLGGYPALGLSAARELARAKRFETVGGADPNALKRETKRQAVRKRETERKLGEVLDQYERQKLSQLRHGGQARRAIDGNSGLLRAFISRGINDIERSDIVAAVRIHAERAPIAANRTLAFTKAFFNWCVDQEIVAVNPAATIKRPTKERTRDRFHTLDELIEIWVAMGDLGYPFEHLFRLLVVIPMRREELAGMPISELDLAVGGDADNAVWVLPAARTKRANALRVPLSPLAVSIIKEAIAAPDRPKSSPFVFSMTGDTSVSGYAKAKRRLDRIIHENRIEKAEVEGMPLVAMLHWTIHDLRTTFSTLACEVMGADMAVTDRILNHVATATRSKIMRIYNKSEMFEPRKRVLREWAALIEREVATRTTA
jgi:integrase